MIRDLYYKHKILRMINKEQYAMMVNGEKIMDLLYKINNNHRYEFISKMVRTLKNKFGQDFIFEMDNNEYLIRSNKVLASTLIQNATLYSLDDIEFLLNEGTIDYEDFKILCIRLQESNKLVSCMRFAMYRSTYKYSKFLSKFKKEIKSELINESLPNQYYEYYFMMFNEDVEDERDK